MNSRSMVIAWLALAVPPFAQGESDRGALAAGDFAVGYRSTWILDEGRTYLTAYDDGLTYGAEKSPRPLLVLLWYPARVAADAGAPMPHGEYFSIASEDPRLAAYAAALRAHAEGIFVRQVLGKEPAELDDDGREELAWILSQPTACHRDAEPAAGRFPLVLYHAGAGSSFEDDAAFCESLASAGFVVIGSAFPKADGDGLGIDGRRGSAEDARFLVRWASALPFVDWRRVALVGHSAGAQAFLRFAAEAGCVADALVLLDTTQDYYGLTLPQHEPLVREITEGVAHLTRPLLVAAGPEAFFSLGDTLVSAERFYLTVPDLLHDEFISQGMQRLAVLERRAAAGAEVDAAELERAPAARLRHRELCGFVRSFLDAQLENGADDFAARVALARASAWTHDAPSLVHVPRGVGGPEPYDPESGAPPTPRQFVRLMAEDGAERACELLERFREREPRGPLYTSTMLAGSLLFELAEDGRQEEARRYYAALRALELPVLGVFEFLAEISVRQGKTATAVRFLTIACELAPEDAALAAKLRELREGSAR